MLVGLLALVLAATLVLRRSGLVRPPAPTPAVPADVKVLLDAWTVPGSTATSPDTHMMASGVIYARELETEAPVSQVFRFYARKSGTAGQKPRLDAAGAVYVSNTGGTGRSQSSSDQRFQFMSVGQQVPGYALSVWVLHRRKAKATYVHLTLEPQRSPEPGRVQ